MSKLDPKQIVEHIHAEYVVAYKAHQATQEILNEKWKLLNEAIEKYGIGEDLPI